VHHHVDPGVFLETVAHEDVGPADHQDLARPDFHVVGVLAETRDEVDRRQVTRDGTCQDEEIRQGRDDSELGIGGLQHRRRAGHAQREGAEQRQGQTPGRRGPS